MKTWNNLGITRSSEETRYYIIWLMFISKYCQSTPGFIPSRYHRNRNGTSRWRPEFNVRESTLDLELNSRFSSLNALCRCHCFMTHLRLCAITEYPTLGDRHRPSKAQILSERPLSASVRPCIDLTTARSLLMVDRLAREAGGGPSNRHS